MEQHSQSPATAIDAHLSEKLVGVSFVGACSVVMLHAYLNSMLTAGEATAWFVLFAGWMVPTFAVPLFFTISGYLLGVKSANGTMDGWYGKAVKKRLRTLLVPYFLWCTAFAVTVLPFTVLGNHLAGRALTGNTCLREPLLSAWNLVRIYGGELRGEPIDGPLWYVRNLFLLVLLSPVFCKIMADRWRGAVYLAVASALFFAHDWMPRASWPYFKTGIFSLQGFLFFPLGLYLARHPVPAGAFRQTRVVLPVAWLGACLLYVFLRLHTGEEWMAAKSLLVKAATILGMGAVWVLPDRLPGFYRLARLPVARDSFFVYACHIGIMFTLMCERSQQLLVSRLHMPMAGIFLLRTAIPVGVSLLLAEGLKRFAPRAYALLTGGR